MARPQTIDPRTILACAADLFERAGFHGATTSEIARAAGISEGALFHYFPTKDALFSASLMTRVEAVEHLRGYEELVSGPPDTWPPLEQGLERVSRTTFAFYQKGMRAISMLAVRREEARAAGTWQDRPGVGPERPFDMLTAYFQELTERGEVVPGEPSARAVAFLGGLFVYANLGLFLSERAAGRLPRAEPYRQQFLSDFVRGLKPATTEGQNTL
jgi:AcrR family transcriptional regulator